MRYVLLQCSVSVCGLARARACVYVRLIVRVLVGTLINRWQTEYVCLSTRRYSKCSHISPLLIIRPQAVALTYWKRPSFDDFAWKCALAFGSTAAVIGLGGLFVCAQAAYANNEGIFSVASRCGSRMAPARSFPAAARLLLYFSCCRAAACAGPSIHLPPIHRQSHFLGNRSGASTGHCARGLYSRPRMSRARRIPPPRRARPPPHARRNVAAVWALAVMGWALALVWEAVRELRRRRLKSAKDGDRT